MKSTGPNHEEDRCEVMQARETEPLRPEPDPEALPRPKRRMFTAEDKRQILAPAEALAGTG